MGGKTDLSAAQVFFNILNIDLALLQGLKSLEQVKLEA